MFIQVARKIPCPLWVANEIAKIAEYHQVTEAEVIEAMYTAVNEYEINMNDYLPQPEELRGEEP